MRWTRRSVAAFVAALAVAVPAALAAVGGDGPISTAAGTGTAGYSGDGGPATAAELNLPRGTDDLADGGFLVAEANNNTVRRVWPDGTVTTVAGTRTAGYGGDGGPATQARLNFVHAVSVTADGGFLIADTRNDRIRYVAQDGTISTVAGTGAPGFSGDGGPATAAMINKPRGVAALPDGGFLIADMNNRRVRRVSPDGTIRTVAGTGRKGTCCEGRLATRSKLHTPFAVAPTADGGFLICDSGSHRVRKVGADGVIRRAAGTGTAGYGGDGGPATQALLNAPHSVDALADGGFLIADEANDRIRRVWPDGTITTVAGNGVAGYNGDGISSLEAQLNSPRWVVATVDGDYVIADSSNHRVRLVDTAG